jgi:hypothetical protein
MFSPRRKSKISNNAFNKDPHCKVQPIKTTPWVFTPDIKTIGIQRAPLKVMSQMLLLSPVQAAAAKHQLLGSNASV